MHNGGPKLHFEADQVFRRLSRCSILKADSIRRKPVFLTSVSKSADGFLEEISKNVTKLQKFAVSECLLNAITHNFKGPRLSGYIIDEISKLLNTTGLNFEDSASERNFEGPRLPERLIDRILEICGFIVPHGCNFKDLWLSECFLKDFESI
ncbi:hypothetical protein RclHR1_22720002 [Rhizophagus clarus]|uniref:Uncharacterized protein n=1 Tax=Rhizophagus clarus TaxID=94130 RepID=A0A2Z6QZF8_9GLOM|nr:hypothetical protein RclHR1_22720002 [Rhizophagus clarus]